jgi:hypothetical protein
LIYAFYIIVLVVAEGEHWVHGRKSRFAFIVFFHLIEYPVFLLSILSFGFYRKAMVPLSLFSADRKPIIRIREPNTYQTSTLSEHGSFLIISGAIQAYVPMKDISALASDQTRLVPKSLIFSLLSLLSSTL